MEGESKFMLIGTYTWLRPPDDNPEEEVEEHPPIEVAEGEEEQWPEIEDVEEEREEVQEREEEQPRREDEEEGQAPRQEEAPPAPKIEVLRVGIPLKGKGKEDVLSGAMDLYLQLRADGFPVQGIHTDRGREFMNSRFKQWTRSRCIMHTTNGGEDPQANGRVERAVQEIKRMTKRLLHGSEMDKSWWPMALRYLMETSRMRRKHEDMKIPAFGEKVLVKKRIWRTKALEATHESSRYLAPMIEAHGHCILRQDGRWGVAPYVIKNIQSPPPPTEEMWLALMEEAERDEVQERRRVRGKRPLHQGDGEGLLRLRSMLKEEAKAVEEECLENAMLAFQRLEPWKKSLRKAEDEGSEILQTKIISPQELERDVELWDEAIKAEMHALIEEKGALRSISRQKKEELQQRCPTLIVVPSKLVITRKAGGRRKVRIVACGNYIEKGQEEDSLYAGGGDATALRACLSKTVQADWLAATLDIKTAFLNAMLPGEGADDEVVVILQPPRLLVKLKYVQPDEFWVAVRAIYGLRQSPKLWGAHRDTKMGGMSWEGREGSIALEPMVGDPNIWKMVQLKEGWEEVTKGLILVYVDDLLIMGPEPLIQECIKKISEEWEISKPEWLGKDRGVKFLGMDIWLTEEGTFLHQGSYLKELLKRNGEEHGPLSGVPITGDQVLRLEEDDPQKDADQVKLAQRAVGELMWLLTRTRPDLMFCLSKMSQAILRNPKEVVGVSKQVWKYLRKTQDEGLWIRRGERNVLEVYTDSSYGPGGADSQGTVLVLWNGSSVLWKSGRQSIPSLSTAESELSEAVEGMVMGDSVDVLVQEIFEEGYPKIIKVDNTAAINLLTEASGSWRTRHLRLKASHVRWRFGRMDWMVEAVPGQHQIADAGTKSLPAPRLEELKKMKMGSYERTKGESEEKKEDISQDEKEGDIKEGPKREDVEKVLKVIVALGCVHHARAQEEEEQQERDSGWEILMLVVLAFVGMVQILQAMTRAVKHFWRRRQRRIKEEEVQKREHVEDERNEEEKPSGSGLSRPKALPPLDQAPQPKSAHQKEQAPQPKSVSQMQQAPLPQPASQAAQPPMSFSPPKCPAPSVPTAVLSTSSQSARNSSSAAAVSVPRKASTPVVSQINVINTGTARTDRSSRGSGRRPAFITPWGTKWHQDTTCPTLANSKSLIPSQWCQSCSEANRDESLPILSVGPGGVAHYDPNCPLLSSNSKRYPKCQRCQE